MPSGICESDIRRAKDMGEERREELNREEKRYRRMKNPGRPQKRKGNRKEFRNRERRVRSRRIPGKLQKRLRNRRTLWKLRRQKMTEVLMNL